jgi:ATP-binding cassette subfamily F protein 3
MKALKKQVEKAEAEIEKLTKHIETLDAQLADGTLFTRDPAKAAAIGKSRAESAGALAKAEEDWLAAGAALQAAS